MLNTLPKPFSVTVLTLLSRNEDDVAIEIIPLFYFGEKHTSLLAFEAFSFEKIFFSGMSRRIQGTVSPSTGITENVITLLLPPDD